MTGWNLPPGCTPKMIEDHFGVDVEFECRSEGCDGILTFEKGYGDTLEEPGLPDSWGCEECGETYAVEADGCPDFLKPGGLS